MVDSKKLLAERMEREKEDAGTEVPAAGWWARPQLRTEWVVGRVHSRLYVQEGQEILNDFNLSCAGGMTYSLLSYLMLRYYRYRRGDTEENPGIYTNEDVYEVKCSRAWDFICAEVTDLWSLVKSHCRSERITEITREQLIVALLMGDI